MSDLSDDQNMTVLESGSTNTNEGEKVTLGRRRLLRKRTSDMSPKTKQKKKASSLDHPLGSDASAVQSTSQQPAVTSPQQKPPNIYIRKVTDFKALCSKLSGIVGHNNFSCRSRFNDIVISSNTSDDYRKIIKYLNQISSDFHCYELPENKSFRVVIRHLHHTTPPDDIKTELMSRGYSVKNVHNVKHPVTKSPLPLFFVDLAKIDKSKEIFKEKYLLYTKINVEEPRRRHDLVQCHICQEYNHSKNFCKHQPKCVKCGEEHSSKDCQKPLDVPATCANCGKNHTANYKGCEVYKALKTIRTQRSRSQSRGRPQTQPASNPPSGTTHFPSLQPASAGASTSRLRPNCTYASLLSSVSHNKPHNSYPVPKKSQTITPNNPQPTPLNQIPFEKFPSTSQKPLPTFHNPSPLSSRNPPHTTSYKSPPNASLPQSSTIESSQHPSDSMTVINMFITKLEALITPLISLMTTLIQDLLPKILK